ncbi:hypothetical protein HCH54_003272 [Aspergillus fumigatus]
MRPLSPPLLQALCLSMQRSLSDTRKKKRKKKKRKGKERKQKKKKERKKERDQKKYRYSLRKCFKHLSPIHPTINRQIMRNGLGQARSETTSLLKCFDGQFVRTSPDPPALPCSVGDQPDFR